MTINENAAFFLDRPIADYDPKLGLVDPLNTLYRLRTDYDSDQSLVEMLTDFLAQPQVSQIPGIVLGMWDYEGGSSAEVVECLAAAHDKLPNLKGIFLGDITFDEQEISWIIQSDVSPLLTVYPQLEYLRLRGGEELSLGEVRHDRLKSLIIETGGLPASVVQAVGQAHLPELEHLELWLGSADYGGDATVEDLQPILSDHLFPKLQYLGLRDCEIADAVATAIATAPILQQVKVLDLSLGNLGDVGATALLESPFVAQLTQLDIHHHYISAELVDRLQALGIEVDATDVQEPDEYNGQEYRYIAVAE
jgi:Leucine Rich repeat